MSSSSALELDRRRDDPRAASTDSTALLLSAGLFALAATTVDLLTYHVNLLVVFIVPLLLVERANSRRLLWQATLVLIVLGYMGYFLGRHPPDVQQWQQVLGPRLVNRTMAAITLVASAMLLQAGIAMRERAGKLRRVWPHDPDGLSYERAVLSIERVLAPALAGILIIALFVSDSVSHAHYNIAVLYALPLLILARTRIAALLWGGTLILIGAALLGLVVGPPARDHFAALALNRVLVCLVMLAVAVIVHLRLLDDARD